jgi:CheY-like chemotaxis protein
VRDRREVAVFAGAAGSVPVVMPKVYRTQPMGDRWSVHRKSIGPGWDDDRVRILLVEDEQPLAKCVATGLRKHGFAVDIAFDGRTALDKCEVTPYDVVVLDWDLPMLHGEAVRRHLAERGTLRILMLTASGAVEDRVDGLAG